MELLAFGGFLMIASGIGLICAAVNRVFADCDTEQYAIALGGLMVLFGMLLCDMFVMADEAQRKAYKQWLARRQRIFPTRQRSYSFICLRPKERAVGERRHSYFLSSLKPMY